MTDISKVSLNEQTARIVRELAEAADLGRVKCWSSEPAPVKWLDAESVRAALLKRRAASPGHCRGSSGIRFRGGLSML